MFSDIFMTNANNTLFRTLSLIFTFLLVYIILGLYFGNKTRTKWLDIHFFYLITKWMLERVFKRECCYIPHSSHTKLYVVLVISKVNSLKVTNQILQGKLVVVKVNEYFTSKVTNQVLQGKLVIVKVNEYFTSIKWLSNNIGKIHFFIL